MYEIEKALWGPETIRGYDKNGAAMYIISKKLLKQVWKRLLDRLTSLDSSTSTIEVTDDYAAHFYDMYIRQHDGKHMTGDRMKILLLNMPFLLRDLVAYIHTIASYVISYTISYTISYNIWIHDILSDIWYDLLYILPDMSFIFTDKAHQ